MISAEKQIIDLSNTLSNYITKDTTFFCIGSNKFIFDSLGPFVGTLLQNNNLIIHGSLNDPIDSKNLLDRYNNIKSNNILVIDSSIHGNEGDIYFSNKPATPAYNRFGPIGNMSLSGIVSNNSNFNNLANNIKLSNIYNMAIIISKSILNCFNKQIVL